jgi:Asp-tRNA(Asn)/Glu-tRNA(Gln) amidotransferase A subunit family amidase
MMGTPAWRRTGKSFLQQLDRPAVGAMLDGCPLGLSVIAGPGEDEALLAFACR